MIMDDWTKFILRGGNLMSPDFWGEPFIAIILKLISKKENAFLPHTSTRTSNRDVKY